VDNQILVLDSVLNRVDALFIIDYYEAARIAPGRFSIAPWAQTSVPSAERATVEGGQKDGFVLALWDPLRPPGIAGPPIPLNVTIPVITGVVQVGNVLTAGVGTWANAPISYSYQWYDSAMGMIPMATSSTYSPNAMNIGHTLVVSVVATNAVGPSAPAFSAPTTTVVGLATGVLDFRLPADSPLIAAIGA
jgi:hypothetical protein